MAQRCEKWKKNFNIWNRNGGRQNKCGPMQGSQPKGDGPRLDLWCGDSRYPTCQENGNTCVEPGQLAGAELAKFSLPTDEAYNAKLLKAEENAKLFTEIGDVFTADAIIDSQDEVDSKKYKNFAATCYDKMQLEISATEIKSWETAIDENGFVKNKEGAVALIGHLC